MTKLQEILNIRYMAFDFTLDGYFIAKFYFKNKGHIELKAEKVSKGFAINFITEEPCSLKEMLQVTDAEFYQALLYVIVSDAIIFTIELPDSAERLKKLETHMKNTRLSAGHFSRLARLTAYMSRDLTEEKMTIKRSIQHLKSKMKKTANTEMQHNG